MKKGIKKFIACIICATVLVLDFNPAIVKAESDVWINAGNGTMVLTGTNITAKVSSGKLIIEGTGAIPDYTPLTYTLRPWHTQSFTTISIGSGITEIGSFAFGEIAGVTRVEINSTTFVKDATSFYNLSEDAIIRIKGSTTSWKQYGTILYSSQQSLASVFYRNPVIMDNNDAAASFRCINYPFIKYVYSASDQTAPWNNKVDITKDIPYNKVAYISSENNLGLWWQMWAEKKVQTSVFPNCMKDLIGEYTFVASYEMTLLNKDGVVYGTNDTVKYVLNIPKEEQSYFKQFRLIEVGPNGTVFYLDDLDNAIETITFSTPYPTSIYALVYKYDMNKLAPYMQNK